MFITAALRPLRAQTLASAWASHSVCLYGCSGSSLHNEMHRTLGILDFNYRWILCRCMTSVYLDPRAQRLRGFSRSKSRPGHQPCRTNQCSSVSVCLLREIRSPVLSPVSPVLGLNSWPAPRWSVCRRSSVPFCVSASPDSFTPSYPSPRCH